MTKIAVKFEDAVESQDQVKARTVASFTMGEKFVGFYQGQREVETQNGKGVVYSFINSNDYAEDLGEKTEIWKSAGLNLDRTSIRVGQLSMITFEGMKTNTKTNRKFGAFKVQVANHELIKEVPVAPKVVTEEQEFDDIEWGDE